ncbi:hypothetical protein E4U61_002663 [Claviceps capensis]|nr:hypothetical protein E4U61_002663 [Claviceps capensis]
MAAHAVDEQTTDTALRTMEISPRSDGKDQKMYDMSTALHFAVLHAIWPFAAADRTTDYRQWQCLFDGFREYIDEPCPRVYQSRLLHVALLKGCTQGMQIVDPKSFEEHTRCLRKFVDLGGSVNPDGDSLIGLVVKRYAWFPVENTEMRLLIYFFLEHHADINRTFIEPNTNMVNEIIDGILEFDEDPPSLELLKELLSDLVDRGLNLTIRAPGLPSPLYCVLRHGKVKLQYNPISDMPVILGPEQFWCIVGSHSLDFLVRLPLHFDFPVFEGLVGVALKCEW